MQKIAEVFNFMFLTHHQIKSSVKYSTYTVYVLVNSITTFEKGVVSFGVNKDGEYVPGPGISLMAELKNLGVWLENPFCSDEQVKKV